MKEIASRAQGFVCPKNEYLVATDERALKKAFSSVGYFIIVFESPPIAKFLQSQTSCL